MDIAGPPHAPAEFVSGKEVAVIGVVQHPVVVIGDVVVDIVIKPTGPIRIASDTDSFIRLGLGGAGANTAIHLAREGVPTLFMGRVGDDALGRLVRTALNEPLLTLAVEATPDAPTGAIGILVDDEGQRTMFPQRGANKYVDPQLVERNWPDHVRGLFVSGYALFEETTRAAARLAIEKARAANVPVAIDPASYANILDVGVDRFLEWCEGATIILPNRHEASVLAGGAAMSSELSNPQVYSAGSPSAPAGLDVQFDMDDVLDRLSRLFPTVVVKLDREGAIVRSGTDTVFVPAQSVPVVDTTGAGDAFNAGFFAAYLAGAALNEALSAGNARAARVVQQVGAS